jgi:phosphatidylserine/phosphatidylglycerophosphate/cardiolipin synthase-like enzyme
MVLVERPDGRVHLKYLVVDGRITLTGTSPSGMGDWT